ncbi:MULTISPECIES: DUF4190 domain-containing protein [unclassified Streptomyces]|uniref:DUF4190 domain-containing protein n=1 Tax=unclassified Streptomyces TaxID=2593676 RepID=UPI000691BB4C|nr:MULTISPECIES: DUF4190 domain-containing protein [unclassified Streptomyces]
MSNAPNPPPGPGHSWPPPPPYQGWAPPPGHGQQPPALNGFALASLLSGLLCFPPLGVAFGIAALVQIAKRGDRGKVLAIVGLVVSVVMTGALVFTAERLLSSLDDRFDGLSRYSDVEGELTDLDDLRAGDCFNVPGGDLIDERPVTYRIDCARVHHGEVTAAEVLQVPDDPESRAADRAAEDTCWKAQDEYAMDTWALPEYAEMFYYAPSRESWRQGDRALVCVIGTTDEEWRGSLRKDAAMLKPEQAAFLRAANSVEFVMSRPPESDVEDVLPEYRAWAREMDEALGAEAKLLQGEAARPGTEKAAAAQLKEIEAARTQWRRASQARTPEDFDTTWDRALAAMSLETEQALRGAYGLSTTIPQWLQDSGGGLQDGDDGSEGGPSAESA